MATKKKSPRTRINNTIFEMATALYDINAIDAVTMREVVSLKLSKIIEFSPRQIKMIRLKEKVSQAVFAKFLNTTVHTIREWEQGKKHPRGTSLSLLNLIAKRGLEFLVA